ncbi:MAG: hypothetical protein KAT05_06365 [Spirochaetes bacterium]|nr:hypothetical protein [Spirochaetota bacterium]
MNAIKLDKRIESDNLTIKGLKKYKGKNAEIIILISDKKENSKKWPDNYFNITYGFMKNDKIIRNDQGQYPIRDEII